jgi:hypothetical protein
MAAEVSMLDEATDTITREPSVDAPLDASGFWRVARCRMLPSVRPLMQPLAAGPYGSSRTGTTSPKRARWHVVFAWFFRPRLADCCAIPSFDRPRVPTASGADLGFTPQPPPELGNSRPSPEGPRRCGPSCWPPPPSPACAAYAPASVPATIPSVRRVDLPDARLNCRR